MEGGASRSVLPLNEGVLVVEGAIGLISESLSIINEGAMMGVSQEGRTVEINGNSSILSRIDLVDVFGTCL